MKKKRQNHHHILPRSRRGTKDPHNLIRLDERRHEAFHLLFKDMTFLEAANLLRRAHEIKQSL